MASAILTQARQSIWAAINGSSDLTSVFKAKRRFEDVSEVYNLTELWDFFAMGDLPGIAVVPTAGHSPWATNQQQFVECSNTIVMVASSWNILQLEKYWQYLLRAIWSDTAGYPLTVAYGNIDVGPATIEHGFVTDGEGEDMTATAATKIEIPVTMTIAWNPRTDTGTLT